MDFAIDLGSLLHRPGVRRRPGRHVPAVPLPQVAAPAPDERDTEACDRVLRELAAAALLVDRGVATRVLVCNSHARIDFDDVRLLADTFDVVVEPIVRVGGGGFDFIVRHEADADE
jgi:hypothetical protein